MFSAFRQSKLVFKQYKYTVVNTQKFKCNPIRNIIISDKMETDSSTNFEEKPVSIGSLQLSAPLGIGTWAWGDQRYAYCLHH